MLRFRFPTPHLGWFLFVPFLPRLPYAKICKLAEPSPKRKDGGCKLRVYPLQGDQSPWFARD